MGVIEVLMRDSNKIFVGDDNQRSSVKAHNSCERITDLIDEIQAASTFEHLHALGLTIKEQLNYDYFGYGFLLPGLVGKPYFIHFYDWACNWSQFYKEQQFYTKDLCVQHCLNHVTPHIWRSDEKPPVLSDEQNFVLDCARDYGRTAIISMPVYGARGSFSCFRLSHLSNPKRGSGDTSAMLYLSMICNFLHEATYRILLHTAGESHPVNLTAREKEILLWSSQGKDLWSIGQLLGISQNTVSGHMKSIYKKMGVSNRQHAVARAINSRAIYT